MAVCYSRLNEVIMKVVKVIEITKVSSYGSDYRSVSFLTNSGKKIVLRLDDKIYHWFKSRGIPTCQKLGWRNRK